MSKRFLPLLIILLSSPILRAADEIPIWDGLAPGTEHRANEEFIANERYQKVYQPSLTIHQPPQELATGAAVLILPGGGYHHIAIFKEGHHTASWLNSLGITAFVLKYRLDREEALQDSLQAMRLIRQNAEKWHINSEQLGIMGFSAGAHLQLNTIAHSDSETKADFLVVLYPWIKDFDLQSTFAHSAAPTIVFGASDDETAPPEFGISVYQNALAAGQAAELHLYESGGHGFGLGLYRGPVQDWTERCEIWFKTRGLLEPPAKH